MTSLLLFQSEIIPSKGWEATLVNPEKAVHFSGGGLSELFPRPAYQDESVGVYLDQLNDTWGGLYNPHKRGVSDVAAQAEDFVFVDHGRYVKVGGTRFVIQSLTSFFHA